LRTSLDINLVELINRLKKKFPNFGGGGHKHACGALLLGENVEEFLAEFINEYSNMLGLKTFKPAF
jgi:oligoribonuclease NrnB/cAMP/cGMP phosphodiesterase (DHH superfamily)